MNFNNKKTRRIVAIVVMAVIVANVFMSVIGAMVATSILPLLG